MLNGDFTDDKLACFASHCINFFINETHRFFPGGQLAEQFQMRQVSESLLVGGMPHWDEMPMVQNDGENKNIFLSLIIGLELSLSFSN